MKKVKTIYNVSFNVDWEYEDIQLEVNEESNNHIRIKFFQERWRTVENYEELFKKILTSLKKYKNNV